MATPPLASGSAQLLPAGLDDATADETLAPVTTTAGGTLDSPPPAEDDLDQIDLTEEARPSLPRYPPPLAPPPPPPLSFSFFSCSFHTHTHTKDKQKN